MVRIKIMKPGTRPERVGLSEATLSKETSLKGKALQAVVDSWCKIQVLILTKLGLMSMVMSEGGLRFV
jgi:lambda repressor-like predicted transcriptional regulator